MHARAAVTAAAVDCRGRRIGHRSGVAAGALRKAAAIVMLTLGALASPTDAAAQTSPPAPGATTTEVTVTAEHFRVQTLIDRTVYSVNADVQGTFGSVADVLGAIPSVEVDGDGNVALRGDSNVLILVDGRPMPALNGSTVADALQQIPAADIERIEVITTPPPEFKAEGAAGILNIVTRRHRRPGTSGTLQGGFGNHERSYLAGSVADNRGPWHLSGTASFRDDDRLRNVHSGEEAVDPATGVVADTSHAIYENIRRRYTRAKGEAGFDLDEQQHLVLTLDWSSRTSARWSDEYTAASEPPGAPAADSLRHAAGVEPSGNLDERLGYDRSLGVPGEKLAVMLHRSAYHERDHFDYTNFVLDDDGSPIGVPTLDNLDFGEHDLEEEATLDWTRPLGGTRLLKAGIALETDDDSDSSAGADIDPTTGIAIPNPLLADAFRFRRVIDAAYTSYQDSSGAWSWLGGLRYEWVRGDGNQLTDGASTITRGGRVYPSLHLDRTLSKAATLSFAVSRRVTLPYSDMLDPIVIRRDVYSLFQGNPNLLPEDTRAYEFGVHVDGARQYGLTAYYRQNRDSPTYVSSVVSPQVQMTTVGNLPKNDSAGLEMTTNGQLGRYWSYALSGNAFHNQIDASALGVPGLRTSTGMNGKLTLNYRPTATQTLQVLFTRSDRRLTPQGYNGAVNQVNLGYRRVLARDLTLVATVTDVFQGQVQSTTWATPTFSEDYRRTVVGRMGYLGFVYRFGATPKERPQNFDYDN
jgi:outer membrane receptor for ferrienterochelin and colicin